VSLLQQERQGSEQVTGEAHDSDYFRRRAAEARAAAFSKQHDEKAAVAGELALAYAALARRRAALAAAAEPEAQIPAIPLEA
jgi:hypothetical protein